MNQIEFSGHASGNEPGHAITMTSLELVDFINDQRAAGEPELRHDHFMVKVPKVLGEIHAPKFLGTQFYGNNNTRRIYNLPKREACLMAMSYSYDLQAKVFDRMTALEQETVKPAVQVSAPSPVPALAEAVSSGFMSKRGAVRRLDDWLAAAFPGMGAKKPTARVVAAAVEQPVSKLSAPKAPAKNALRTSRGLARRKPFRGTPEPVTLVGMSTMPAKPLMTKAEMAAYVYGGLPRLNQALYQFNLETIKGAATNHATSLQLDASRSKGAQYWHAAKLLRHISGK